MTSHFARFAVRSVLAASIFFAGSGVAIAESGIASAKEQQSPQNSSAMEIFAKNKNYSIVKSFKTDDPALTGYVLKNAEGRFGMLYTLNNLIIGGPIVTPDGVNLTEKYMADNIPKPDYQLAAKTLDADKTVIIEGKKSAPVMYVIADPNCIFCHKLWQQTRDWVAQGKIQIRWAMVGFLKPSSKGRAAAIMTAKDKVQANTDAHTNFDEKNEEGSIAALDSIPKDIQDALHKHEALMNDMQFQGTPGIIFKDKDAKWQGMAGMPSLQELAASMGFSG